MESGNFGNVIKESSQQGGQSPPLNKGGSAGIGTTAPEARLHVNRSTDGVAIRAQDSDNFKCDINPGSGADWSCASDIRKKKNIIELEPSLSKIMALQPRKFNLIANGNEGIGFIAQEVQEVLPDMVDSSEPDNLKVSTGPLMPRLVKAIQEQQQEIGELKQSNDALKEIVCQEHPQEEICKK